MFTPNLRVCSQGVTSFWAATPNTAAGDVITHWIEPSGDELIYRKGERQCILVASGLGRNDKMYAHLRPCDAKLSDGIVSVAAAAAPPPPPGGNDRSHFDPLATPPPPPSLLAEMWSLYSDREVRPRTVGICEVSDSRHSLNATSLF
jgi:hypothetical protein